MATLRLLSCIRVSVLDIDSSTSPERQVSKITAYADAQDHTVVGTASDLDVSGAVSPFLRPELGVWLSDPAKIAQWDGIVVAKLDRLTRSLFDFLTLWQWLDARGKTLICLDPQLDFSTPIGRMVAQVLILFAEFEREQIRARVLDAYNALVQAGQYPGGAVPFGLMPVKRPGTGWDYAVDPEYGPVVAEMVDRFLSGQSMRQVALWCSDSGIPTSRDLQRRRVGKPEQGGKWSTQSLRELLRNPAIAGLVTVAGQPLRDSDGMPVQRCEGVISVATWKQVMTRMEANSTSGPRSNSAPLLQVVFCGQCDSPMYATISRPTGGKTYHYYRCSKVGAFTGKCTARMIKADWLEWAIEDTLLDAAGDVPMRHKVIRPAENHAAELEQVTEAITAMQDDLVATRISPLVFADTVARLEARQTLLRALPSTPEQTEWVASEPPQTFRQHWMALEDDPAKNAWLRTAGVRMTARHQAHYDPDLLPTPDPAGRVVLLQGEGYAATVWLGDVAHLQDLAAAAG